MEILLYSTDVLHVSQALVGRITVTAVNSLIVKILLYAFKK